MKTDRDFFQEKLAALRDLLGDHRLTSPCPEKVPSPKQSQMDFLAAINHEFRTPLTTITGTLALLQSGRLGPISPEAEALISASRRNIDTLSSLIQDVLDLRALEIDEIALDIDTIPAVPALAAAIQRCQQAAQKNDVDLFLKLVSAKPSTACIRADKKRLDRIVDILLANACKHSAPGGAIAIAVDESPSHLNVIITEDHPKPISADNAKLLSGRVTATPLTHRMCGGDGIAFALSQGLAERMGGLIWIDKDDLTGARIRLSLPLATGRTDPIGLDAANDVEPRPVKAANGRS